MNSSIDSAYMAGIIDGEGTLVPYGGRGSGRSVSFVNTHRGVIDWAAARWPGHTIVDRPRVQAHYKDQWMIIWTSKDAILALLDDIQPHMIIKSAQAQALREEIVAAPGSGSPGVRRKTECTRGHPRAPEDVGRTCRECQKAYMREYRKRKKAERD